jgi:endonuclease YncB( thermonuclease family)
MAEQNASDNEPAEDLAAERNLSLSAATLKNTKVFGFKDFTVDAKVVKVYDGDTCTCVFDTFGMGLYRHQIRLNGIDTAEIKSKDADVKALALRTRDFVADLILNKIVQLTCEGSDKYGRILGIIRIDGVCINNLLIEKKMALPYDGGTKTQFDARHENAV